MFAGGKDKYMCLLSLIRRESPKLYEIISDLCLDGTFRTTRYLNTFLMPNEKLIEKLSKMVDDDKDEVAVEHLRSLIIKGSHEIGDFKKPAKDVAFHTMQTGTKILKSPADVASHLIASKKVIIYDKKNDKPSFIVYEYKGDSFPETEEGKKKGGMILTSSYNGGQEDKDIEELKEITKDLIVDNHPEKTMSNFFNAVSGVLAILENEDSKENYDNAKFYLAANPILSWFFLTMPGNKDALVKAEHLKGFKSSESSDPKIISECMENNYSFNKDLFKKINSNRSRLISEKGDKTSLMDGIQSCYQKNLEDMREKKSIDSVLSSNVELKVLMDELRFMYDNCVKHWEDIDDTISRLGNIDWNHPKKDIILCDPEMYKNDLVKGTEAFTCGPVAFVKSVYFLYIPLTEMIQEQLEEMTKQHKKGAGISGGNPNNHNYITFKGGAARKMSKKSSDLKLESLVKVLSHSQRCALKNML